MAHFRPIVAMQEKEVDRIEAVRYNVNAVISDRAIQAQWSMSSKKTRMANEEVGLAATHSTKIRW